MAIRLGDRLHRVDHATQGDPPRFPIYSIAKSVLATLVVKLSEEGALSLDDRLDRWHPDVPGAPRITLRALLQHRAGLRDYGSLPGYHTALATSPGEAWKRATYAAHSWDLGLQSEPEREFAYSNPGYRLVRELVEQIEGSDLAEIVARRITEPLRMTHTRVIQDGRDLRVCEPALSERLGPAEKPLPRDVREWMDPDWVFHGTLVSTAGDVLRFFDALASDEIVSPAGLAQMSTLRAVGPQGDPWIEPGYGLGLMGDSRGPHGPSFGHEGGGPGYTAAAYCLPQHSAGPVRAVVLCASEDPGAALRCLYESVEAASR